MSNTPDTRKMSLCEVERHFDIRFRDEPQTDERRWELIGEYVSELRRRWPRDHKLTHDGMTFTVIEVQDHETVNVTQDQTGTRMKFHPNEFDEWRQA
jgi:CBS domain containing-hemolysin-like protein